MPPTALALVAASVLCHATWNLLAKRAGSASGPVFVGMWSAVAALLWAPLGVWTLWTAWTTLDWRTPMFIGAALVLHTGYYLVLQRGYRVGDLSVVYPVARGTGPLLASSVAVLVWHEQPGLLGWAGILALSVSVALLGLRKASTGIGYGLLVGVFIAAYTLLDKQAVTAAAIPPILVNWGTDTLRALSFTPLLVRRRAQVRQVWRDHWKSALGTAIFSPASYMLILTALTVAPVTVIAPLREVSVVLVVFLGARLLGERDMWRRLVCAFGVVLGAAGTLLGRS
ncbi:MAG: EamA family transporter [Hamadaea sp.]|nr:EamA family transporter [Hamadaea sp.]